MSSPSKITSPSVGSRRRSTRRASVLFPHPDSPTSPSVSPRHREVDAVHSLHVPDRTLQHAGLYGEVHLQIPGLQQILAGMTVGLRATARPLGHIWTPSSSSTR